MILKRPLILFVLIILLIQSVLSDIFSQNEILEIDRIENIQFDGKVDEVSWQRINPVPLVQYSPDAGAAPSEKTEIRFAYDDKYFYGSIRAFDSEPDKIRGNSLYRDRLAGSDHFEILLDSYNDNESAFIFNTISTGVRTDAAIANDATGGTISSSAWFNGSFNTFWDTKVSRDSMGWYAETRIPFSSLRFQNIEGNVIMGLSVQRKIARKLERLVFPAIPPENDWAFLKPSMAQKILIKDVQPTKSVYISPYILSGGNENTSLNSNGEYERNIKSTFEIGGDVKFSITNNVTADFTVNTDFAQVEADDQLINLSRFSLFFPEKRQFFQERSGIFEFRTGNQSRLFFSRRIGLTENGQPVPIIGGARLVGRFDTWDVGVLNMQTKKSGAVNSENFGVVRIKRRVFNDMSTIGGMLTSRIGPNGEKNIAYGIDGLIRIFRDDFLTVNWSQTFDSEGSGLENDNSKNGRLTLEFNRRLKSGIGYNVGFIYSGKNYLPELGFVDRSDGKFATATLSHTRLFPEGSSLISRTFQIRGTSFFANGDEGLQSAEVTPEWSISTRTQDRAAVEISYNYESLSTPIKLSGIEIPTGIYEFVRPSISYRMAGEKILRTGIDFSTGKFYDGWLHSLGLSPTWFVSKHLELGLQYQYNNAVFSSRNESADIHVARLRVGTAVNSMFSTNAFIQFSNTADLLSANIRMRYNFREGNDLWVVFNDGLNTDRPDIDPRIPLRRGSSLLIKYVHTFLPT